MAVRALHSDAIPAGGGGPKACYAAVVDDELRVGDDGSTGALQSKMAANVLNSACYIQIGRAHV